MIWPWSRIRELELKLEIAHRNIEAFKVYAQLHRADAMQARKEIRGAHKGIKRLKDKLKKVEP